MNRYRRLETEYALAAHECERDGRFKTIATINLQMAAHYADKADEYDRRNDTEE